MRLPKDDHPIRLTFLAATLTLLYLAILLPAGFLEGARLRSYDAYTRWRSGLSGAPPERGHLLVVAIDDESQQRLGRKWPWGRDLFAKAVTEISKAGPKLIMLDYVFSGASDPAHDHALAQAIAEAPPVVLAAYLDPQGDPILPQPLFTEAGGIPGLIDKPRDADLAVRRLLPATRLPLRPEPLFSVEIQAAALFRGVPPSEMRLEPRKLKLQLGSQSVPLIPPTGFVPINYLARPGQIPTVPFWKVLQGSVPAEEIRGKIVLIGSTSEIAHDICPTPVGLMPGIVVIANGILTLLTGAFIHPFPPALALVLGFFFVLTILLCTYWLPVWLGGVTAVALTAVGVGLGFLAVVGLNLQTESLSVLILGVSAWSVAVLYRYLLLLSDVLRLHRLVITDPVTGLFTERYFWLKLTAIWPRWTRTRKEVSAIVVRTERPSVQLQQSSWPEVQERLRAMGQAVRDALKGTGAWVGRAAEDEVVAVLPRATSFQAKAWAEVIKEALSRAPGHQCIGLASTGQIHGFSSATDLIRCAQAAAQRAWLKENRSILSYDPMADSIPPEATQDETGSGKDSRLSYVADELQDRNRAVEKALSDLREAHKKLESHFLEVTKTLVMALETRDEYTAGHLERVSRYSTRLAEVLHLPIEETEAIREAALLHDIGKIGLPDEVLHKVGQLSEEEKGIIKQHLAIGARILEPMKFFKPITALIYHHHERYDGKGYPHGLTGEFIPPGAQVIAIADSFDAMTTNRGYNKPLNVAEALMELRKGAGTQFNPAFVEAFSNVVLQEGPHLAGYTPQ